MRRFTTVILPVAFLLLAGCAKDPTPSGGGIPMHLAPTLAGETKGSLTTADLADFYLQVVSDDTAFSYFTIASKASSGIWTTPSQLLWKSDKASVRYGAAHFGNHTFTASEFQNGVSLTLPTDQHTQEKLNAADLLTMTEATIQYEDTIDGTLPVTLSHGLAKIIFTITLGADFYDKQLTLLTNPVTGLIVSGTDIAFHFNPKTGAVNATEPQAEILPLSASFSPGTAEAKSATATYEAILVPQSLAAGELLISFQVGNTKYKWSNAAAVTLAPGQTYDLAVSITNAPTI
jgi:hypothetical protein